MKNELAIAKKIFNKINPVSTWTFTDIQEDVEDVIERSSWEELDEDDIKEIVEDAIKDKLYDVFYKAVIAASTEEEKKDEQGIAYVAGQWSFLAFERGEKFLTEKEIFESVRDDVEYERELYVD